MIDIERLEFLCTLCPAPGTTVAHVECDRNGAHSPVSVGEDDGAAIVCDVTTLEEIRRLPMRKPSGKYSVVNKITFSHVTSH